MSDKFFVSLGMSYIVEIHNRVRVGFALGWSWYSIDEEYDYGELILFIGLISINIKYTYEEV
jgi:long-subunit fatty acid transport protein